MKGDGPRGFEATRLGDRSSEREPRSRRGQWRLAARLARREVRRHPWRHVLVVAMIFVPVLAAFATFSLVASWQSIGQQKLDFEHAGATADGVFTQTAFNPTPPDLGPLPRGSVVERRWESADWLVTPRPRSDGRGPVLAGTRVFEAPLGSRSAAQFVVELGRLPKSSSEILISPPLASAGGWHLGSTVESARSGRHFRVVGIGVTGDRVDVRSAAVAAQPLSYWARPADAGVGVDVGDDLIAGMAAQRNARIWLRDGTDTVIPKDRHLSVNQVDKLDSRVGPSVTLGAAAMSALVAVVASAAFAIASRRQLRTVGLLASAGADPATIRIALMLQGAIPGALAGIGAVAAGLAAVDVANSRGAAEWASDVAGARVIASPGGAVLAVALGLGAGVLAAWQPARAASKVPVLSALAGRRPVGPVPGRVPLAGLVAWTVGALLVATGFRRHGGDDLLSTVQPFLLIGAVAAFALGGVGLAPVAVAAVGHLAGRTSGTTRLALRGLARHRTQSAATVAAVGIALALPVGLLTARAASARPGTELTGSFQGLSDIRRDGTAMVNFGGQVTGPEATAAKDEVLALIGPPAILVPSVLLADDHGSLVGVAMIDETAAPAVLTREAARAIVEGNVIAVGGSTRVTSFHAGGKSVPVSVADIKNGRRAAFGNSGSQYLIGNGSLRGIGAGRPVVGLAVLRPGQVRSSTVKAISDIDGYAGQFGQGPPTLTQIRRPPKARVAAAFSFSLADEADLVPARPGGQGWRDRDLLLFGLAATAGAVALLVLTITLSLRSVDTEGERRAAIAAGASPARMRRQRALEGLVLAGLGAALALPLGWVPVTAGRAGFNARNAAFRSGPAPGGLFHLPGWEVLPILGVPVLLAGLAWLIFPALADRLRRGPRDQVIERW